MPIRLVGGSTQYEGRVEVFINRQWGTVCDDLWGLNDAHVVCRQLGYGPATSFTTSATFGRGSGPIVMDDVDCRGDESTLLSCGFRDSHNCAHSEDAGVVCSGKCLFDAPRSTPGYRVVWRHLACARDKIM